MIYNLDPGDAWERRLDYEKARGLFENYERMWQYDSPLDFMEDAMDPAYFRNQMRLEPISNPQLKKELT